MGSGKGGGGGRRRIARGGRERRRGGGGAAEEVKKTPTASQPVPPIEGVSTQKRYETDPTITPGGVYTGPGELVQDLPANVQGPIHAYTGGKIPGGERFAGLNAEKLNRSLYDPEGFKRTLNLAGESPQQIADYMKRAKGYQVELDAALSKVRNYEGEVYRSVVDEGGAIAKQYEPGSVATMKGFTSASRSPNPSYKAFNSTGEGHTRFIIQSKTGKHIEQISLFEKEREVLFRSGTSFRVVSRTWNAQRGTWDIKLAEI